MVGDETCGDEDVCQTSLDTERTVCRPKKELFEFVVIQDVSTDPDACAVGHPGTDLMFAHYETNLTYTGDLELISGEVVAQGVLAERNDFASTDAVDWSSGLQGDQCLAQREDGTVSLGCGGWIALQFETCFMGCWPALIVIPGDFRSGLAESRFDDYIGAVTIGEYGATCGDTAPDRYEVRLCEKEEDVVALGDTSSCRILLGTGSGVQEFLP